MTRLYPELLSEAEHKALLNSAERLWADLQANNLGGFSDANRPFWIVVEFKRIIEAFGRRDVGFRWSQDELDAARAAAVPTSDAREIIHDLVDFLHGEGHADPVIERGRAYLEQHS